MRCSFCGREIDITAVFTAHVTGKIFHLCPPCQSALVKAESACEARSRVGKAYFSIILDTVELDQETLGAVRCLAGYSEKPADIVRGIWATSAEMMSDPALRQA